MQVEKAKVLWKYLEDSIPGSGLGYELPGPSHEQFMFDSSPTLLASGGERGSKSHTSAMKAVLLTLDFIAKHPKEASGAKAWIVAESYELCRPEFEYIAEWLMQLLPGTKPTNMIDPGQINVPVPGGEPLEIKTRSAADPKNLRAEAPVWTLLCEAALVRQDVYFRLLGRSAQARAQFPGFGQLIMSGTFENSLGWYPTLWTKWQSEAAQKEDHAASHSFPSHENRFIYPGGLDNEELKRAKAQLPEDVWKERHLAIPAPPSGRVFGSFDVTRHVAKVQYDPDLPVYFGVDPGYSGRSSTYAVVVTQPHDIVGESGETHQQWHVIDEIAINKLSTPGFTVRDICEMVKTKYWWGNDEVIGVIDVAGTYHAGAQESNTEVWQRELRIHLSSQKVDILPGIDRFKTMLTINPDTHMPNMIISPRARLLISELGGAPNPFDGQTHVYSYKTDTTGQLVSAKPHDDYCDSIKALTYLFVNKLGYATGRGLRQNIGVKRRTRRRIKARI